jgi:hypothetical protein
MRFFSKPHKKDLTFGRKSFINRKTFGQDSWVGLPNFLESFQGEEKDFFFSSFCLSLFLILFFG